MRCQSAVVILFLLWLSPASADDSELSVFGCDLKIPGAFKAHYTTAMGTLVVRYSDESGEARGSLGIHAYGRADEEPSLGPYFEIRKTGKEDFGSLRVFSYVAQHKTSHQESRITVVTDRSLSVMLQGAIASSWKEVFSNCVQP